MAVRELILIRLVGVPRCEVWDAYTVPERLALWWAPGELVAPLHKINLDLREGGSFELTMIDPDGIEYPSEMVFRTVEPPGRLVYGWDGGEVVVTFSEDDAKTLLVQRYTGEISDEMFPVMEQGTGEQLDQLVALLSG
ncbi:SRPBCC domain-containing protein [Kineosporia sp. J2-2]|uniref:SRPBCC domain-containing protein n=1 Tax=Kineosporia corallincola TaxID=2835133 RepID=A0ABS5TMD5_9ACTN|nr:SRPBCC domain-containing protein [Kineosporia corallincola]MBT0772264.1 SRPBCC domain-containing protein [Kineosporia corallincola]